MFNLPVLLCDHLLFTLGIVLGFSALLCLDFVHLDLVHQAVVLFSETHEVDLKFVPLFTLLVQHRLLLIEGFLEPGCIFLKSIVAAHVVVLRLVLILHKGIVLNKSLLKKTT